MNVLRDTHRAVVPGGLLLDFHPVAPPWPQVVSRREELGELRYEPFVDDLKAAEGGMAEAVRRGLFELVGERTREIATHFDDPNELLDEWLTEEEEEWASPELEERIRSSTSPVDVVNRVVFRLYRTR